MEAAQQVNSVIDKLADKLGIAAEQLKPVAETVIREYQLQAIVGAIACGAGVIVCLLLFQWFLRLAGKLWAEPPKGTGGYVEVYTEGQKNCLFFSIMASILTGAGSCVLTGFAIHFTRHACAPTYYCLLKLLS